MMISFYEAEEMDAATFVAFYFCVVDRYCSRFKNIDVTKKSYTLQTLRGLSLFRILKF